MTTSRIPCCNDGAGRHQHALPYPAIPVVREQASYALNFVGLIGLLNLVVSQQVACLTFIYAPKLLLGQVKNY